MRQWLTYTAVLAVMASASCASPVASERAPADVRFTVVFTPEGDGSGFSAQIEGQTFTLPGQTSVTLAPGEYTLSGAFHGSRLSVGFVTIGGQPGGVLSGSMRSTAGPAPDVAACTVAYTNDTPITDRPFSIDFTVTDAPSQACPGPGV
jgi:hypothetical protein